MRAHADVATGAERGLDPDLSDIDQVQIHFAWEVPSRADEAIIFILDIRRDTRESVTRFALDLTKLETANLQRLHDLLATRQKGYRLAY
jgi:hypothetical protein